MIDRDYHRENLRCQLRLALQLILGALIFGTVNLAYLVVYPKGKLALVAAILASLSLAVGLTMLHERRANKRRLYELGDDS